MDSESQHEILGFHICWGFNGEILQDFFRTVVHGLGRTNTTKNGSEADLRHERALLLQTARPPGLTTNVL